MEICTLALADEPFTVNEFHKTSQVGMVVEGEVIKGTITYDFLARTIQYNGFTSEGEIFHVQSDIMKFHFLCLLKMMRC